MTSFGGMRRQVTIAFLAVILICNILFADFDGIKVMLTSSPSSTLLVTQNMTTGNRQNNNNTRATQLAAAAGITIQRVTHRVVNAEHPDEMLPPSSTPSMCSPSTTMAIHILHYVSSDRWRSSVRNEYVQKLVNEFCRLPFATVDIFVHTNNKNLTFQNHGRRQCTIHIVAYTQAKWWITIMELLGGASNKGLTSFVLLGWSAREHIAKTAHNYDIVMCMENDILVPVRSITHYWCVWGPNALEHGHHLQFLRYDLTPPSSQY
eukprot:PhF_6_TR26356/c0_g1_i3/m.37963